MSTVLNLTPPDVGNVAGEFVDMDGERYYAIRNFDNMKLFFMSVVSNVDHWLFVSSTGGLTAGRVSPETALFPYITVDKLHDSWPHTGPKTIVRLQRDGQHQCWEPFNPEHDGRYALTRNLYKSVLGNKLCFEEINHDLELAFRYTWVTSEEFGFSRQCRLLNTGTQDADIDLIDGIQNVLPAGTPRFTQTNSSNLVDAYKWTEADPQSGLALFSLYSGITDRAEPCESLKANVVYSLGLETTAILVSAQQLLAFRRGAAVTTETHKRGLRGAFFVSTSLHLGAADAKSWQIVANIEQTQAEIAALQQRLKKPNAIADAIETSVRQGSDDLAKIMAVNDAYQTTAEENVSVHHYANVLFNVLRGGFFDDQYQVSADDFRRTIKRFNRPVFERNRDTLSALPDKLSLTELKAALEPSDDEQLLRLCLEYLPIRFGRRHGDPSRPWNQFAINLRDEAGDPLLSYEGNWRDIFQNWEALAFSYPGFVENIIAKFVNASTVDGYNPYRVTKEGIDWEVEEPDNPWSYIGYWGDHQIIYLQKLLELSNSFHPTQLRSLLRKPLFAYANVPYRILPFDKLVEDPKNTVIYDDALSERIDKRVAKTGSDGKLVLGANGDVYQVNLLEKLLVALLAKLGNLVVDGGIWMNTQRPEWNDANNALVGQGLSMVTLYYMRRYVNFLRKLLATETDDFELSTEVQQWLAETAAGLAAVQDELGATPLPAEKRYELLVQLGQAASKHREELYRNESFSGTVLHPIEPVRVMLGHALVAIDHSIAVNVRDDGMFHAYNTLEIRDGRANVGELYAMLEGQVAALSAGNLPLEQVTVVLKSLFDSNIYRDDQKSFMLYPDRELPSFQEKNTLPDSATSIPLLDMMLTTDDRRIVHKDISGRYRFNAEFSNVKDLRDALDKLTDDYGEIVDESRETLQELFEDVFDHRSFTGRSGTMFGFEGLGCIYWHMVAKLMLATQENYFRAIESGADARITHEIGELYYRIRGGIGFNKTPAEYGAFPTDPYSHSPKHSGARQPGMTGQVKEEILTRFGELGIRVDDGRVSFLPALLRAQEFVADPNKLHYQDVNGDWQELQVPERSLAFTWCQVPIVYTQDDNASSAVTIHYLDGSGEQGARYELSAADSASIFARDGRIRSLHLTIKSGDLFSG